MRFNEIPINKEKIMNNYGLKLIKLIRNNIIKINSKFNLCVCVCVWESYPIIAGVPLLSKWIRFY